MQYFFIFPITTRQSFTFSSSVAIVINRVLEHGELIGLDIRGFPAPNQVIITVFFFP